MWIRELIICVGPINNFNKPTQKVLGRLFVIYSNTSLLLTGIRIFTGLGR